jgi:hypothetical protein
MLCVVLFRLWSAAPPGARGRGGERLWDSRAEGEDEEVVDALLVGLGLELGGQAVEGGDEERFDGLDDRLRHRYDPSLLHLCVVFWVFWLTSFAAATSAHPRGGLALWFGASHRFSRGLTAVGSYLGARIEVYGIF